MGDLKMGSAQKYNITGRGTEYESTAILEQWATNEQLEQWAADPGCIEQGVCASILAKRKVKTTGPAESSVSATTHVTPFDPRTEVSADARHIAGKIVMHLWILFVALPIALAVLYLILK
jgi:hypothetical protein